MEREHPKEKERDRRKKTYLKESEKNFKKELSKWLDYEDKIVLKNREYSHNLKERDYRKEREREKERDQDKERQKQRLLERQLEYDSEDEKRRKTDIKYLEQRKKARQKEL